MKKNILKWLFCLPALALTLGSCDEKEDLFFEYEQPQFNTSADAILLEVVVPVGTAATDQIFVVGDFNGGEDAIGNVQWQLEKAENTDAKFGIYLYPNEFVSGKTLADGYYFYSMQQGEQRTVFGDSILLTDNVNVGGRLDLKVDAWAARFNTGSEEIKHDGYAVYVNDKTGWANLYLYMWGDVNDLNGGWPGMTPTGTQIVNGVKYKYFDMGEANEGRAENLIFNNGDGTQLADFAFTIDRDIYLTITTDGVTEETVVPEIKHDGYAVFVLDQTGWEGPLTCYMWGDVNDLNAGWPGMTETGTVTIKGNTYKYFDMGEANTGLNENLIFSNNGASQLGDFNFTIERDIYLVITTKTVTEIDPDTYVADDQPGTPEPNIDVTHTIYVQNNSSWTEFALYAWGDKELFGGWPGAVASATETIGDVVFYTFTATAPEGATEHLIFNNNDGGAQFDGPEISFDRDYYLVITDEGCTETDRPAPTTVTNTIYVKNLSGWSDIALYAWGTAEVFGGWPGAVPASKEVKEGVEYLTFQVTGPVGGEENLIFNNNGGGAQFDAAVIQLGSDYYFTITDNSAATSEFAIYVDDKSGWEAIALYMWGDKEYCGGWPGMTPTGKESVNGTEYTVFKLGADANGLSENPILNNNGGGAQFDAPAVKLTRDYYFTLTTEGVTEK